MSNEMYDKLKIVTIAVGCLAGFITGVGELIHNNYFTVAGAIIMLADSALMKFLEQSSKQYWTDKEIVIKKNAEE